MHLRTGIALLLSFSPALLAQEDLGPAAASLALDAVTVLLKPTTAKQQQLEMLLAAQQDPGSPSYHQWLTPEQFADKFGRSQREIDRLGAWLTSQGMTVKETGRGRNWMEFSGTAGQIGRGLGTTIHRYRQQGLTHYANAGDPVLPVEFRDMVGGFTGLNDYPMKPGTRLGARPVANFNGTGGVHYLAPDDLAAIYDIAPLASIGVNGTGLKIAVVGQSSINVTDIQKFRTMFKLPASDPQVIVAGADPGVKSGDQLEAHLDIEWAGAIAPNATILYVYAPNVQDAARYVVNQNLAPILSMSFYGCEPQESAGNNAIAQQANAQGITWIASSGDSGAASCDGITQANATVATQGLTVSSPASYPEVTAVGGTTFNEGGGNFWSAVSGVNGGSALGYIPEVAWNDSGAGLPLLAGGGGASAHYAKPPWQNVAGVPADGARDVPDVALSSSPGHDGYLVYSAGQSYVIGGTSAATPVFAGMVALLNQSLVNRGVLSQPGLGNINPVLYRMFANTPGAFHDVTAGSNVVPCQAGTPNCVGGLLGYYAGPGYDQVTGLGSVDVAKLVNQWNVPGTVASAVVLTVSPNPAYQQPPNSAGNTWLITLKLVETGGGGSTITGLTIGGQTYPLSTFLPGTSIAPYGTIVTTVGFSAVSPLPATIVFHITGGDPNGRTWSQQASVILTGPQPAGAPSVAAATNGASFKPAFAPGMVMSVFGTNLANAVQLAKSLPLPAAMQGTSATVNGVSAPLYYVSPGQVNLQVPYGTSSGTATVVISNNGQMSNLDVPIKATAPGIFAANGLLVPLASAKAGVTLSMFITGEGQVSPGIATGATPAPGTSLAQLPKPVASVQVTVGGVNAAIAFIGIPNGLAGTTQVNFVVPAGLTAGAQPVVVTVGGASSPAVILTVLP